MVPLGERHISYERDDRCKELRKSLISPHFQSEFLHAQLVRRDGGALDSHVVLLGGLRRLHGHLEMTIDRI